MRIIIVGLLPFLLSCQSPSKTERSSKAEVLMGEPAVFIDHGLRSGEAYFSPDGKKAIFQSELPGENPFYQIFLQDLEAKQTSRVSPGYGKATCAWILPNEEGVFFSSTHEDPDAQKKAVEEIQLREQPQKRSYSWDYDPEYEIYLTTDAGKTFKNLSKAKGYDAEGSASPDGKWIVFASNRHAYRPGLKKSDAKKLAEDPSYFLDLYMMDTTGGNVRRLTRSPGYDGGPFFSPDGKSIVWRRFAADGRTAEIFTMDVNGKNERQITQLGTMSWAPYFHPSGEYIVFTTPVKGHRNFELFIVDTEGLSAPIQVTEFDGFDGLPVFTPDGNFLTWNRPTADGRTQVFKANWNHDLARKKLGLHSRFPAKNVLEDKITVDDLQRFVKYLSSEDMQGRMTGSAEEAKYTQAIAEYFRSIGLKPFGDNYIHEFSFPKASRLLERNNFTAIGDTQTSLTLQRDWMPSNNSKSGQVAAASAIFAGYGISAPDQDKDAYANANAEKKWVVILEGLPKNLSKKEKLALLPYSSETYKTAAAAQRGARGVVFIKDAKKLSFDTRPAEISEIPVVNITAAAARKIFKSRGFDYEDLQNKYATDLNRTPIDLRNKFSAAINISREFGKGRNVLAQIPGATHGLAVMGAHGDHLGKGKVPFSLSTSKDTSDIHYGADDNASGVAAVLEVAHQMAKNYQDKPPRTTLLFAIWSGEELGNLGSQAFLAKQKRRLGQFKAYLNLDMVGRMVSEGKSRPLNVLGLGSSAELVKIVDAEKGELAIETAQDPYLPTDAMAFYLEKIPVIGLFTGSHSDYHTPRDRIEKLDFIGLKSVAEFSLRLMRHFAENSDRVRYQSYERKSESTRFRFSVYLGTIPDYNYQGKGVRLAGVVSASPAEKAGLKEGDIIISYDGEPVTGMQDYMKSLQLSEADRSYPVQIQRDDKFVTLNVSPLQKENR